MAEQQQNVYYDHGNIAHGTPAEQAAFAREELSDAFVDEPSIQDHYSGGGGHDSIQSFGSVEDQDDPSYLYSVLEEALSKQLETGAGNKKFSNAQEQQLKRDHADHTWELIRRWLRDHPHLDQRRAAAYVRGQADATSLHLICKILNPPEDIVLSIVDAAPDVVSWTDTQGWLPLHHACAYGASPEIVKILCDTYPQGKIQQDKQFRTPLHFYVTRTSDSVTSMTVNAEMLSDTGAAALTEHGGMLPMHYACAYGTHPAVLNVLAEVYPESLTAKENHGRTPVSSTKIYVHFWC